MVLISIVIGLALEKCCNIGRILYRFTWFSSYLRCCRPLLVPCTKITPFLAVTIAVLLPVIIVGLLYWALHGWIFGLVGFLIGLIVGLAVSVLAMLVRVHRRLECIIKKNCH